jgi:predicted MFS family arabinose efflux permease
LLLLVVSQVGFGLALNFTTAAAVAALALRILLPPTAVEPTPPRTDRPPGAARRVAGVCLATVLLVVGHYIGYGYLALLIAPAGVTGTLVAVVLAGYGVAGLGAVALAGGYLDTRPRLVTGMVVAALPVALAALGAAALSGAPWPVLIAAVLMWGAAAGAMPVVLQTAVLRAVPDDPELPSASYVLAYRDTLSDRRHARYHRGGLTHLSPPGTSAWCP